MRYFKKYSQLISQSDSFNKSYLVESGEQEALKKLDPSDRPKEYQVKNSDIKIKVYYPEKKEDYGNVDKYRVYNPGTANFVTIAAFNKYYNNIKSGRIKLTDNEAKKMITGLEKVKASIDIIKSKTINKKDVKDGLNDDLTADELKIVDKLSSEKTISQAFSDLNKIETDDRYNKGKYGVGGGAASVGELMVVNASNDISNGNMDKFFKSNSSKISNKVKEISADNSKKRLRQKTASIIGIENYDDNDPEKRAEVSEYLAKVEVYTDIKTAEMKKTRAFKDSAGYKGDKEALRDWVQTSIESAIANDEAIKANPSVDTSKPINTFQVNGKMDKLVKAVLINKIKSSKGKDKEFYEDQLKKYNSIDYHDTVAQVFDKKGRIKFIHISNKKDTDLKDPHNNTTPEARINELIEKFGEKIPKKLLQTLEENLEKATDANAAVTRSAAKIKVSPLMVKLADKLPMSKTTTGDKYIKKLSSHRDIAKMIDGKADNAKIIAAAQKYMNDQLNAGKVPSYEVFGKFFAKYGQLYDSILKASESKTGLKGSAVLKNYKITEQEAKNILKDKSIKMCYELTSEQKDTMKIIHEDIYKSLIKADKDSGHKGKENGPHVQAYIESHFKAMHFDKYIVGYDEDVIISMGARSATPKEIRSALINITGYQGPVKTDEDRQKFMDWCIKNAKIIPGDKNIKFETPEGSKVISYDEFRTAGTSKKITAGFGDDFRFILMDEISKARALRKSSK